MKQELNMATLEAFLSEDIDCKDLAEYLDEMIFEYTYSLISNASEAIPGPRESNIIYWVKALRDAIWRTRHPDDKDEAE